MLHRVKKANDASHEKWIGVGGKCEANESPDECMVREVREETGIEVTRWRYRGIVTFISNTWPNEYMHLFTATEWRGRVGDCDEGDLAWVDKKRLEELNLWQGDRLFLRLLLDDGAPFFSMKLVYVDDNLVEAKIDGHPVPLP